MPSYRWKMIVRVQLERTAGGSDGVASSELLLYLLTNYIKYPRV